MKLIIQIPCYNEEKTLPETYRDLPKKIAGVDLIETLIINDGSRDNTVEVAKKLGINHIVSFCGNRGLASAFRAGIEKCLEVGADIIVNTDADNQYCGEDIAKLVQPIIERQADVVVGDRQTDSIEHFSWMKKKLQRMGTKVIRNLSKTDVNDAVSGFRAYSAEAARHINIISDFSYTIENLIQLGFFRLKVISVPIRTNSKTRESRLFKNIVHFIGNQLQTTLRAIAAYRALSLFTTLSFLFLIPGLFGLCRFLYFFIVNDGNGHIQSVIVSSIFVVLSFLLFIFGALADQISTNRRLLEMILINQRKRGEDANENK